MNSNINTLSSRHQDGEHLALHEDYALMVAIRLNAIVNGREPNEENDNNHMTVYDYLCDTLDIEYRTGVARDYRSVKVAITLGGPACWIDTDLQAVLCSWGSDTCICEYGRTYDEQVAITTEIDEMFSELYMLAAV